MTSNRRERGQLIYARNNIWSGTEYALSNANPSQPLDLDYDDLYTTLAGELAWWDGLSDRHLNTLAELQAATGQEMHGLNVVPGFANAAGGDYTLDSASDLIDAGVVIPGINDGYVGAAPDIGAFEYRGLWLYAEHRALLASHRAGRRRHVHGRRAAHRRL